MYLTRHPDVDRRIIHQLAWHDMMSVCQSNKDIAQLCDHDAIIQKNKKEAKSRAVRLASLLSIYPGGITIQPSERYFVWDDWLNLLRLHHIPFQLRQRGHKMSNQLSYVKIQFYDYDTTKIEMNFVMYKFKDLNEPAISSYLVTMDQLLDFLTVCYYDQMILLL